MADHMICHRFTAAIITGRAVETAGVQGWDSSALAAMKQAVPCIGSQCAMWVPEIAADGYIGVRCEGPRSARWTKDRNYNDQLSDGPPSGRGWCADNLRRNPVADPALAATAISEVPHAD